MFGLRHKNAYTCEAFCDPDNLLALAFLPIESGTFVVVFGEPRGNIWRIFHFLLSHETGFCHFSFERPHLTIAVTFNWQLDQVDQMGKATGEQQIFIPWRPFKFFSIYVYGPLCVSRIFRHRAPCRFKPERVLFFGI